MSRHTLRKMKKIVHKVVLNSLAADPLTFQQQGTYAIDESVFVKRKVRKKNCYDLASVRPLF